MGCWDLKKIIGGFCSFVCLFVCLFFILLVFVVVFFVGFIAICFSIMMLVMFKIMISLWVSFKERRKEMFYLTTHSTHFILRLYGVRHMVKGHSDNERGNPLPPIWTTLSD